MSSENPNNHIARTIARTIGRIAAALVVIGLGATPSYARPDPGAPTPPTDHPGGCLLQRVETQFVRCDNMTGNGVAAPKWIPEANPTVHRLDMSTADTSGTSLPATTGAVRPITEQEPARTLGATAEWAWAQRLQRELCVRYGDSSCSG